MRRILFSSASAANRESPALRRERLADDPEAAKREATKAALRAHDASYAGFTAYTSAYGGGIRGTYKPYGAYRDSHARRQARLDAAASRILATRAAKSDQPAMTARLALLRERVAAAKARDAAKVLPSE